MPAGIAGHLDRTASARLALAGLHALLIRKVPAPEMIEQVIGPVDVLGIDRCHDERSRPDPNGLQKLSALTLRLNRARKARRKREGILHDRCESRIALAGCDGRHRTRNRSARKAPFHDPHHTPNRL